MANVTQVTNVAVSDFIATVEHPTRRADAMVLHDLMARVTGCPGKMWGGSIVGFGRYHYRYDSGREGESMLVGFSPRKSSLSIYIMPGFETAPELMAQLGKYKTGKSCLYVNKLADVDIGILEQLVARSIAVMHERHEVLEG